MAYKITFNYNGGDSHVDTLNTVVGQSGKYSEYTFSNGDDINFGDSIPLPTANQVEKDGYVLIGWSPTQYDNSGVPQGNNSKKIYVKEYTVSKIVNNTQGAPETTETLYAVWKSLNPLRDAISIIPQLSRVTETTMAPANIADLLASNSQEKVDLANSALKKMEDNVKVATADCYVVFTIPEYTGVNPAISEVKFTVTIGKKGDFNAWRLSEAKNTPEYKRGTSAYSSNTYEITWNRKGVDINDSDELNDGDVLTGKVVNKSQATHKIVALPMTAGQDAYWLKAIDFDSRDKAYSISQSNYMGSNSFGNVIMTRRGNQTDTVLNSATANSVSGMTLNACTGEEIKLSAASSGDGVFEGWYRREYSFDSYYIKYGTLFDETGDEVYPEEIVPNHTYYKDVRRSDEAVFGVDYWPAPRMGYYKLSDSPNLTVKVDNDDMYNQYVALFSGTTPTVCKQQIPFYCGNIIMCDDDAKFHHNGEPITSDYEPFNFRYFEACDGATMDVINGVYGSLIVPMGYNVTVTDISDDSRPVVCNTDFGGVVTEVKNKVLGDYVYKVEKGFEGIEKIRVDLDSIQMPAFSYIKVRDGRFTPFDLMTLNPLTNFDLETIITTGHQPEFRKILTETRNLGEYRFYDGRSNYTNAYLYITNTGGIDSYEYEMIDPEECGYMICLVRQSHNQKIVLEKYNGRDWDRIEDGVLQIETGEADDAVIEFNGNPDVSVKKILMNAGLIDASGITKDSIYNKCCEGNNAVMFVCDRDVHNENAIIPFDPSESYRIGIEYSHS